MHNDSHWPTAIGHPVYSGDLKIDQDGCFNIDMVCFFTVIHIGKFAGNKFHKITLNIFFLFPLEIPVKIMCHVMKYDIFIIQIFDAKHASLNSIFWVSLCWSRVLWGTTYIFVYTQWIQILKSNVIRTNFLQ